MTYDLIIIGAGPAGITASVYAARKRINFLVVSMDIGGQTAWSGDVENYTGYQFITGPDLSAKFEEHMRTYKVNLKEGEKATKIEVREGVIHVRTDKGEYAAKTVIVASGKKSRELGVPGEREYKNKGLTYCATCDAPLFSGKAVAVIGGGNSALDAALQLLKIASHVYLINITPSLGGDAIMREKVQKSGLVTVMNSSFVTSVAGDKMVKAITVKMAGKEETLAVEGIFVEIGLIPNSGFVKGVDKNAAGEIKVDAYNRTNIPGIFAAGDVTDVPEKQIIIAAGEGAKAALGAFRYLNQSR
ncbi:MAG: FAD-dependent oxidoreductase [Candidatus Omnitrophica bacterium]|nr:FAD-dependent oxidoreductase [Candidatus Omnitrophota bacterium]